MLKWRLKCAGITFRIKSPTNAFWDFNESDFNDDTDLVDATFVDDEAIALIASSPAALQTAITILLEIISFTFADFILQLIGTLAKLSACVCSVAVMLLKYVSLIAAPMAPSKFLCLSPLHTTALV